METVAFWIGFAGITAGITESIGRMEGFVRLKSLDANQLALNAVLGILIGIFSGLVLHFVMHKPKDFALVAGLIAGGVQWIFPTILVALLPHIKAVSAFAHWVRSDILYWTLFSGEFIAFCIHAFKFMSD